MTPVVVTRACAIRGADWDTLSFVVDGQEARCVVPGGTGRALACLLLPDDGKHVVESVRGIIFERRVEP